MFRTSATRWAAAAVVITAAVTCTWATPAAASHLPIRKAEISNHDPEPSKQATATCPEELGVIGAGGRIVGGAGGVVLAAVIPDLSTASVTARGEALPGHEQPWAVTAVAVCGRRPFDHALARSEPGSTTATCPAGMTPAGTGFDLPGSAGELLLTGLVPDLADASVTVETTAPGGVGTPPVAYAICLSTTVDLHPATTGPDDTSPKIVTVTGTGGTMTGVGAAVEGAVADVFIDALLPSPDLQSAGVRAVRIQSGSQPAGRPAGLATTDPAGDWSVTGEGIETHDYY